MCLYGIEVPYILIYMYVIQGVRLQKVKTCLSALVVIFLFLSYHLQKYLGHIWSQSSPCQDGYSDTANHQYGLKQYLKTFIKQFDYMSDKTINISRSGGLVSLHHRSISKSYILYCSITKQPDGTDNLQVQYLFVNYIPPQNNTF